MQNTPLHPIAEWGRLRFGGADATDEGRFADLENTLRLIGLDAAENAPLLAPLVDIPLRENRRAKFPPEELRRRQLAAMTAWVLAGARNQPAVIAFEPLRASLHFASAEASTPTSPRGRTKIAQVIELLQRGDGATLAELVAATGWLPHTTRAALTGLRKRGYAVGIDRADKVRGSVYRIEPTEMEEDSAAPHAEASQTCEAPPDRPGRAASLRTRRAA